MNRNLRELCDHLDTITVDVIKNSSNFKIVTKVSDAIESRNSENNRYFYSCVEARKIALNITFDLTDDLTDSELDLLAGKIADYVHNITKAIIDTFGYMDLESCVKKLSTLSITVH